MPLKDIGSTVKEYHKLTGFAGKTIYRTHIIIDLLACVGSYTSGGPIIANSAALTVLSHGTGRGRGGGGGSSSRGGGGHCGSGCLGSGGLGVGATTRED